MLLAFEYDCPNDHVPLVSDDQWPLLLTIDSISPPTVYLWLSQLLMVQL